jgi:hypothetical protein
MTTPTPAERPEVPRPGMDAMPPLDRPDAGTSAPDGDRAAVPADAERAGTVEDEIDAARRHP